LKKLKLTNLYYKKRSNHCDVYYRYKVQGKPITIRIGSSNDTVSILKSRYEDIKSRLWAEKNGFAPAVQEQSKPVVSQVLFKDIYLEFVADVKDSHGKSWARDLHNFKTFVEFFGSEGDWVSGTKGVVSTCSVDLAKITTDDIESYFKGQASKHAKNTINCRHKYVRPLYRWLVRKGHLDMNYYAERNVQRLEDDSIKYQALPMEIVKEIIGLTKVHEHKVLWTIMAYTGLSPVDAGKLSKTDSVVSNGTFDCIITKRNKTRVQAQIPILGDLDKLGDLIFNLNLNKTQRDDANKEFVALAKQVGVKERKGFKIAQYSLRHSLATFLRVHLTDNELALVLGHTDTKQQLTYTSPEAIELHQKLAGVLK